MFTCLSKTTFDNVQHSVNKKGYIQNIKKENIILLSNSTCKNKISTRKQKNNNGFSTLYPITTTFKVPNNELIANSFNFNKKNIYNLSNNANEIHKIRAP